MTDTDIAPMGPGGTLWSWPNQQVVRTDQRGPGIDTPPLPPDPVDPTITGLTPAPPYSNAANVPVSIAGTGFIATSSVNFDGSTPASITYVSATQLDVVLEVMGIAAGTKDLQVVNAADGTVSAMFPVEVTAA
jgi:hypothetical protein